MTQIYKLGDGSKLCEKHLSAYLADTGGPNSVTAGIEVGADGLPTYGWVEDECDECSDGDTYYITASFADDDGGTRIECNTPEILGGAYGEYYPSKDEAISVADDLASDIEYFNFYRSTEYEVRRVGYAIPVYVAGI